MTKVFDDKVVEQAFRDAERALAAGDPDTLAGRFSPHPRQPKAEPHVSERAITVAEGALKRAG